MAKKSKIEKAKRQERTVTRYHDLRQQLKREKRYAELEALPRDSSPARLHNRCRITGRPHGFLRKFGVSRIVFRELAHAGEIPGVKKASW